jgi:hypothetical protein
LRDEPEQPGGGDAEANIADEFVLDQAEGRALRADGS